MLNVSKSSLKSQTSGTANVKHVSIDTQNAKLPVLTLLTVYVIEVLSDDPAGNPGFLI